MTGLLHFEFVAVDFRAMDIAICLSKYAGESDPLLLCREFCEGYRRRGAVLTAKEREREEIPTLITGPRISETARREELSSVVI